MSKTVVGLCQSISEAHVVRHELVDHGYSSNEIRVVAEDQGSATIGKALSQSTSTETGLRAAISNFFQTLTGVDEDSQRYVEGIRNGGAILTLTVPDGQEKKAIDLLKRDPERKNISEHSA